MRLLERYARWAGLDAREPRWGWIWMLTLHSLIGGGVLMWAALALWLFWKLAG